MRLTSVLRNKRFNPNAMGPIKTRLNYARQTIKSFPNNKSWYCGGYRSASIAAQLMRAGSIVALPTDTVYGLAGLAQDNSCIEKLYQIKERDPSKPLAICLSNVNDIVNWAHTEDLPKGLIKELLPGPTTLVLKRKSQLNPGLNPGEPNVGVRVPHFDFVRSVVRMVNQPLALTSANKSNLQSSLHPSEFEDLWPQLGGIFYEKMNTKNLRQSWRRGSTVIDLTVKGKYRILRYGIGYQSTKFILTRHGLEKNKETNEASGSPTSSLVTSSEEDDDKTEDQVKESEAEENTDEELSALEEKKNKAQASARE